MNHSLIDVDLLYVQIGKSIQDLRRAKKPKLTQAGLAELLGVTRTSITNIEKGRQRVPLHMLYTLCAKLSVQISDVIPAVDEVLGEASVPSAKVDSNKNSLPPKTAELLDSLLSKKGN